MKCPFCGQNLIEGDLRCPNCRGLAIDFDYFENMDKMRKKYSKSSLSDLSSEKLTFDEIVTIYTYIERADHTAVTVRFLTDAERMEPTPTYPKG